MILPASTKSHDERRYIELYTKDSPQVDLYTNTAARETTSMGTKMPAKPANGEADARHEDEGAKQEGP